MQIKWELSSSRSSGHRAQKTRESLEQCTSAMLSLSLSLLLFHCTETSRNSLMTTVLTRRMCSRRERIFRLLRFSAENCHLRQRLVHQSSGGGGGGRQQRQQRPRLRCHAHFPPALPARFGEERKTGKAQSELVTERKSRV